MTSSHRVRKINKIDEFNEVISNGVTIVEYSAEWCSPCAISVPAFQALSKSYRSYKFVEVDVDELYDLCEQRGIGAAPAYQIYKNGEKVDQIIGVTKEALEEFIKKNMNTLDTSV